VRRYSNLLPLAILKFATPPPASVSTSPVPPPNTAIRRPCPTTPIDFPISLQAPIFKISTPESPHYNNADESITDFCLIIENSDKVSFQTCNDLVMCALCDDSGPLQVLHRQDPSQFRIHVFFRLQSGILPALTPGIRWSDRASVFLRWMLSMESRHCPVSSCRVWRSHMYWPAWVLTRRETVRMLVWHGLLFEPGTRGLAKSLASSRCPGWISLASQPQLLSYSH